MMLLIRAAVLLGCLAHVSGEPVLQFGACTANCDGGYQTVVTKMCRSKVDNSASYPCEKLMVDCNTQLCKSPWTTPWSDCSASCGGGTRQRSSVTGAVESVPCNAISCSLNLPSDCFADVVFAIDSSASIGLDGFDVFKQMAMDIERSLPVSESGMHIGYVKYSATAEAVFSLTDSYNQSEIVASIWDSNFVGGTGCSVNGLAAVRDMFNASATANYPRVVIFFTDGPDSLAATEAYAIAQAMKPNVDMYVVQLGVEQNILLFADGAQYVFPANMQDTPSKIANAILVRLRCIDAGDVVAVDFDDSLGDILKVTMKAGAKKHQQCSDWSEYGSCSVTCGDTGYCNRHMWCVTFGANGCQENITEYGYDQCFVPCPTTTTTDATTTTEATTTVTPTPSGPYPDCRRCNYTKGQVWFPDPENCHLYYICDKIDRLDGTWYFRVYHPTCGELFWDQDRLTCVRTVPENADCTVDDVVIYQPPSTTYAPCPYRTMADPRYFQSIDNPTDIFNCVEGFVFLDSDEPCTCIPVNPIAPTCDGRLLLHFPYEVNFDDVTCHKAKGYSYGDGQVQIVYDDERGQNVAEFDGKSRIEVPFMRNWLMDQHQSEWTVAAWVKRVEGPYIEVGIVDNGDCEHPPTFLLYGDVNIHGGATAFGGVAPDCPMTTTEHWDVPFGLWTHLAVVYDGTEAIMYVNGVAVASTVVTGPMLNNQNPLKIGMQGCCECMLNYFKGRIDDVRIYTVALSAAEILKLAK